MSAQSAAYRWQEEDWFDDQDHYGYGSDDGSEGEEEWGAAHAELDGTSKPEHLAHRLMRSAAPLLCAATLFGTPDRGYQHHVDAEGIEYAPDHDPTACHRERRRVELSDPEHRVAREMPDQWHNQDFGQRLRRVRENSETGYLSGGESTAIYIADIKKEEFESIVDIYLAMQALPPKQEAKYREFAMSRKRDGGERDVDILEKLIAAVENPE